MNPLCSIVVSSYNKAPYLAAAVDSALGQTYGNVEVVVIDDGSMDDSMEVLRSYRNRIVLASQDNEGQASAINRGFLLSSGDIVFFLDADDVLFPNTVERVVKIWTSRLSKVHFRLQKINLDGSQIRGKLLPPYRPLPNGDLMDTFLKFAFYPAPPTTGNAFSRKFLDQIMPIPEEAFRGYADTYLIGIAPLFGEIGVLPKVGASWRQHDGNLTLGGLDKIEAKLMCDDEYIRQVRKYSRPGTLPECFAARWPQHLKDRLIVEKFGPGRHQSYMQLFPHLVVYLTAVLRWPEYNFLTRLKFVVWAVLVFIMPRNVLKSVPGIAGPNVRL